MTFQQFWLNAKLNVSILFQNQKEYKREILRVEKNSLIKNSDRKVIYNEGNCRVILFLEFHQFFPDNPHAGAWYASVYFSLSYFLVNLLQSKRFKFSPTSTLGFSRRFLFLRLMINLWHLYQVRHRERSSGLIVYIQNNCSDQNNVLYKKFIITKIV